MEKVFVQHMSGQGKQYEVNADASGHDYWYAKLESGSRYDLPKSEYKRCDEYTEMQNNNKHAAVFNGCRPNIILQHNGKKTLVELPDGFLFCWNGEAMTVVRKS